VKTWEVKLDTKGNGLITINVQADEYDVLAAGVEFTQAADDGSGSREQKAFFPTPNLLSIKDVTP
jgi:hypothetical protein